MTRAWRLGAMVALLVGCRQTASVPLASVPTAVPSLPASVLSRLAPAPTDPDLQATAALPPSSLAACQAIARHGGLLEGFEGLDEAPAAYTTQLLPEDTQLQAEQIAHQWADDARQLYIGWGFWKIHWLGKVRHVYYSARLKRELRLEYSFLKCKLAATECAAPDLDQAFLVLRDAYDDRAFTATRAYRRARDAGYRPTKNVTASLLHLALLGPVWVFLDDATMNPTYLVRADSGEVLTDGPLMIAVRYLVNRSMSGGDGECQAYSWTVK